MSNLKNQEKKTKKQNKFNQSCWFIKYHATGNRTVELARAATGFYCNDCTKELINVNQKNRIDEGYNAKFQTKCKECEIILT